MNNHITDIEIKNFKKFDHLVVKNIGQFNLITGDNNVGKTCLLESLLIDEDIDKSIENIHHSLCKRQLHIHPFNIRSKKPILPSENYFNVLKNKRRDQFISFNWKTTESSFNYKFEDVLLEKLEETDFDKELKHNFDIGRPSLWIKIYINDVFSELQFMYLDDFKTKFNHGYQPFIGKDVGFNRDINNFYAEEIGLGENESLSIASFDDSLAVKTKSLSFNDKKQFINNLSLFFNDIEDVMIKNYFDRRDILSIKLKRYEDYVPITHFGDGTHEFIRYILEIQKCKSKRLMIDEIGTGIHYSKLTNFWKIILQVAQNEGVQLFCTTHSKECIESFVNAVVALQDNFKDKIRLIELEESKNTNRIYASSYSFEQIITGIDSEVNLRG